MSMFHRATREQLFLRLAISGPSGAGKTYTSLKVASILAAGRPIAVLDTEHGSASKYAGEYAFDVLELADFHPDRYVEAIQAAAAEGYGVIILDSLSHAWNGKNGILELVSQIEQRKYHGNKDMRAWSDVKVIENRLIEAIVGSPIHIIATMRSKTEYVQEQDERGRSKMRKVGLAPVQRDGMEYEFDIFMDMTLENAGVIQKTRCPALAGAILEKPGQAFAETLLDWLTSGEAPASRPAPSPSPATPATPAIPTASVAPAAPAAPAQPAAKDPRQRPATETQLTTIGKLARQVGEELSTEDMTFADAASHIARLSKAYQQQQLHQRGAATAGLARSTTAERPAAASASQSGQPDKSGQPAGKPWTILADPKIITRLGNHGITGAEAVSDFAEKADAIYSDQESMSLRDRCYALLAIMEAKETSQA